MNKMNSFVYFFLGILSILLLLFFLNVFELVQIFILFIFSSLKLERGVTGTPQLQKLWEVV